MEVVALLPVVVVALLLLALILVLLPRVVVVLVQLLLALLALLAQLLLMLTTHAAELVRVLVLAWGDLSASPQLQHKRLASSCSSCLSCSSFSSVSACPRPSPRVGPPLPAAVPSLGPLPWHLLKTVRGHRGGYTPQVCPPALLPSPTKLPPSCGLSLHLPQ
jgi:hypothetical protein